MVAHRHNSSDPFLFSLDEIQQSFVGTHWEQIYPVVLQVEQAAQLAGVPRKTIYEWSSRGLLRHCSSRFGRRLRIDRNRFVQMLFPKIKT